MAITKKLLKRSIEDTIILINSYNEESRKFPQIAHHNDKRVLKLQGKIEAYYEMLNL